MELIKACKDLLINEPYYGLILLNLNKCITTDTPTLDVSIQGINFYLRVNPTFWDSLLDHEQLAVLKHELMHICLGHLGMSVSFVDKKCFNIAADCEINQYIDNIPEGCIDRKKLEIERNISLNTFAGTNYYYKQLYDGDNQFSPNINNKQGSHDNWKDFSNLSDAERTLITNQIDYAMKNAATQVVKSRGTIPGELKQKIDSLFKIKQEVFNWKTYFRRLMGTSFRTYTKKSKRKLSKRFAGMAGIKVKQKHHILVGIDTSGSVSESELLDFFSEITHMYKAGVAITIVECDASIKSIYQYKGVFPGKITGRGGTNFDPVIKYYNENINKYTTLVYFTDGECNINVKPKKQMCWVITSEGSYDSTFPGKIIQIPKINK